MGRGERGSPTAVSRNAARFGGWSREVARYLAVAVVAGAGAALALDVGDPLSSFSYLCYAAVGAILVARRPGNLVGWVVFALAFSFIGTSNPSNLDVAALRAGTPSLRDGAWAWVGSWAGNASFFLYLVLTLTFPEGRLPMGRWRTVSRGVLALGALLVVVAVGAPMVSVDVGRGAVANVPNPLAIAAQQPLWRAWEATAGGVLPIIALLLVGVASMLARYRSARGVLRLQLRWLIASLAFVAVAVLLGLTSLIVFGDGFVYAWLPAIVAFPTVPFALALAILRYRLFDIDLIIRSTVAYAILSALLAAVYLGTVTATQLALRRLTGGASDVAVVGSTLLVAALVLPLRRLVQRTLDRRFYRSRIDGERALRSVAATLQGDVVQEHLTSVVLDTIERTLQPRQLSLWLRAGEPTTGVGSNGRRDLP